MTSTNHHNSRSLRKAQEKFLFPCVTPLYREPIVLVEGRGVHVVDAEGNRYLDFFAGILTTSLGHCHPEVVQCVQEQVSHLGHTSTMYVTRQQIDVARKLAEISPGELRSCYFTNSGTEAVETAITLAQVYTGRQEIIALRLGYSGRSMLATNITAHAPWRPVSGMVAGIKHARSPYLYRSPFDPSRDQAELFAQEIDEVIKTCTNGKPAALIAETIQGVGGYVVPPPGYFQRAADIIRSHGGLFICDEVQTGFGRTGSRWFGIEHWGVDPDIMVMAKGIANGFPVGATITRPEIAASWTAKTISTYGGNSVSMAAASATIDVMRRENTPKLSEERGSQLRKGLDALYEKYEWIGEVRGMGLMQGMELVRDRTSKEPAPKKVAALLEASKKEGLLIGLGGLHGHVVRMGPSMLVSEEEVADALGRLARACAAVDAL